MREGGSELPVGSDQPSRYLLRLYVTGMNPRSANAIRSISQICERELRSDFELEVVDIYQQPSLAEREQIVATPTLIKRSPLPARRLVGDMSNSQRVMAGLGFGTV